MSDTMTVRDHSKPCDHGWLIYHDSLETGDCPGGKERTFESTEAWFEDGKGQKSKPWNVFVEVDSNE